jgi:hypothetical protein
VRGLFTTISILLLGLACHSQLPDSTLAPNFNYTDLEGIDHELYDYVSEGNFVFLDCFAVWCEPCWNQLHNLHDSYAAFGPNGEDNVVFLALEIAANTADDLTHPWGVTGDWASEIEYPIINDTPGFIEDWNTQFTPAFYIVRPDSLSFFVYPPTPENIQIILDSYVPGCTDELACNFNSTATHENGDCDYSCFGCTNELACNFNSLSSIDDGSCESLSCSGCMDLVACNYDSGATIGGICEYASCSVCTNLLADNYDPGALLDNGTCAFDEDLNSDHVINVQDLSSMLGYLSANNLAADFDTSGQVEISDLLHFLTYIGITY